MEIVIWRRVSDEAPLGVVTVPDCASDAEYDRLKREILVLVEHVKISDPIVHALQQDTAMRLSYGNRWLVWDGAWGVYKEGRSPRLIVQTEDEGVAVRALLESSGYH